MINKKRHLTHIKPTQKVIHDKADQLDQVVYDEYVLPSLEENGLLQDVRNNMRQLDNLISQVCYLNEEIHSVLKK